ncbi:hypothetical protein BBU29805_0438 [Borreliella burgdorferi 29805]|uniref:Uncharacterized protein n=2 Tax=Borreliella TaxID=64895 RepID=B9X8S9_9SPIR|nr:hypothetical protein BGAPBR_0431 [Borreliella garinii PBr]EED30330.1 hypothetical protein BGAFAR04_0448 [Borreliella garinii Far04]EEE18197.1 hypothetical protein BBU72A_0426 [Borreliella burgdorferi 72a]EEF82792.1 hypothetical protein BBUWI9123_0452 [Borreliella burgdorferi WI91-23]EEF83337.1 hypothetical protein BBUCA112A_0433 [Borreliella burgdorferi CA-11.2A]EEF84329.1 hypothetical protein BSPA14S_0904 [Borreliella spielmanii A14S]EEH32776.1 hypothetical protein BBU29805_0438 [Borrelie
MGEKQTFIDPKITEWSNPASKMLAIYYLNNRGDTRGSEPSKYPEEKKSKRFP